MKCVLRNSIFILVVFLLCIQVDMTAQPSYHIPRTVFGSGGGMMSGPEFQVRGTVGQAAVGVALNTFHRSHAGFWYTSNGIPSTIEEGQGNDAVGFVLFQNHPNPFGYSVTGAPVTVISYILPARVRVVMVAYDLYGRKVAVRHEGIQEKGYHELEFDGTGLPAGVYLITMRAGKGVHSIKALLIR